jgi:DNA repair protein RadC
MTITEKPRQVKTSGQVYKIMIAILEKEEKIDQEKEHFWVLGLNAKGLTKYIELVSLGTLNNSLVHPREVFGLAIIKRVASIILCHNHPSGDPEPSINDLEITKRLVEAGKILGIEVLDHVIISTDLYLSLKAKEIF